MIIYHIFSSNIVNSYLIKNSLYTKIINKYRIIRYLNTHSLDPLHFLTYLKVFVPIVSIFKLCSTINESS